MVTNSKKILEALPDFQDFMNLADRVKELYVSRMKLENQIKAAESHAFWEVMNNPKYFINSKPVPVSYFENCYKHRGLDGEISEIRDRLAEVVSELDRSRQQFEIYERMLEMHKTLAYQEKAMS
jgi:hypothetical protein